MKATRMRVHPGHSRLLVLALLFLPLSGLAESWTLSAEEWSRPRSAEVIMAMPAVSSAMRQWEREEGSRLELVYPGGERGELWAAELRDWLVALGAEADRIAVLPGSGDEDELLLRLR